MAFKSTKKPGVSGFGGAIGDAARDRLQNFNFGKLAEDILSLAGTVREDGRSRVKGEIEKLLQRMDLVTRREFDAVRDIAIAARTQAEELAELLGQKKKPATKPAAKSAAKKAPAKKPVAAKKPVKKPAVKKR